MAKSKKAKVQSVEEKKESKEVLPLTVNSEKSGPMSKEEWCKAKNIARPGSNYAQTEYDKYIASLA